MNGQVRKCVFCNADITEIHPTEDAPVWQRCWSGGTVDRIDVGYGSRFDKMVFIIAICDNCIEQKHLSGQLEHSHDY